jgi:GTP-binding protein
MSTLPTVAIVGRPNVGKSSLLNALVGKRISIVQDMPGVTRDRVSIPLQIDGRFVELVDTGGYGHIDADNLTEHINHQIELAMSRADLALFIVDCHDGLTSADGTIAALLREKSIKTILVANKADGPNADVILGEFARLGLGTPIGVSAATGRNIDQLRNALRENVDLANAPTEMPPPTMHVAIVGKRNAGKSTLVNSIAGLYEGDPERVIVSEVPGTTRDSVDVRFDKDGKSMVVIDTAGVRKKRHMMTNDIEFYSFHRAERSIRRADVVLMLIDGTETVSEPDKKLAQYIASQFKPVLIVVNKWDLARETAREQTEGRKSGPVDDNALMEQFKVYLDAELKHIDYAPIAFITAKDSRGIQAVVDMAGHLFNQAGEHVGTGRLNAAVRQILEERKVSTPTGRMARVYYVTQPEVHPPTIVLFVNKPEYIDDIYQRYMINRMRELLPYAEVPIRLVVRGKEGNPTNAPRGTKAPTIDTGHATTGASLTPSSDATPRPGRKGKSGTALKRQKRAIAAGKTMKAKKAYRPGKRTRVGKHAGPNKLKGGAQRPGR